jgi:hypothetical protein
MDRHGRTRAARHLSGAPFAAFPPDLQTAGPAETEPRTDEDENEL